MHIEPAPLRLGGPVRVRGSGCLQSGKAGDRVQILLGNLGRPDLVAQIDPGSIHVAADGTFTSDASVPENALPGRDQVVARCFGASGTEEVAATPAVTVTVQSAYVASVSPTKIAVGEAVAFHGSCPGRAPYDWLEMEFVPRAEPGHPREPATHSS